MTPPDETTPLHARIADLEAQLARLQDELAVRDAAADDERERALRDSRDFARLALSAVGGVGVWTYEVASDRFFCDEAVSRLYAIDATVAAAGILREGFLANVHPDDRAALRATMSGGLVRSGDLELEYRIVHADGAVRWVLSRGHTYFDDAGQPVRRTGVAVEMTRQRLLEEQLRQSQKLEAVGQLTGGIAHDFNNSLSTISTSLELLRRRMAFATPAEIERYLGMASRSVRSAASLTQRLLAFSRNQTLDMRAVDVNRVVREMDALLRSTIGEGIVMKLALADEAGLARTDAPQLENALLNLAINSRDAMPNGGHLAIATQLFHVGPRGVAGMKDLPPGDYVAVSISDTGTGMPPEVAARAFDPFYTTKPVGKGTGLGLSMIYGYAKQSGGDVTLYSHPGVGTTITIFLPRAADDDAAHPEREPVAQARNGDGEHVLVVEDDADVRAVIVAVLADYGYATTEAADADGALAHLRGPGTVDLLLTDVGLGAVTGRELAHEAQRLRPGLKVLFVTGYARFAGVRSEFLGAGMDMMSKPFAIEDLAARVHRLTRKDASA